MNVDKGCTTHHNACDCREAAMKKLINDMLQTISYVIEKQENQYIFWETCKDYKHRAKKLFGDLK